MLAAFGHVLSFLAVFAATAEAAERADFADQTVALLCGVTAVVLTRLHVRGVVAVQRAISAWQWPNRQEPVWTSRIPVAAVIVYATAGLALVLMIMRAGRADAASAMLVAIAAGCNLLNYLWTRLTRPSTPPALDVVDDWLGAQAATYRTTSYSLSFLLLFAGVGAHAFESGLAAAATARCGSACAASGFVHVAAGLCGLAAIAFVLLFAAVTEALRWSLVDSWRHVRPGPPPAELPSWVVVLHVLLGFCVFLAMARYGLANTARPPAPGHTYLTVEGPLADGRRVILDGRALLELALGWWAGGLGVLKFFWSRRRAAR